MIFPLGFRLTCYYYRRAYYRSFWWSPPACAVADAHSGYTGETRFPLILQNIHRYFFYLGLIFNMILTIDAVVAFNQPGEGIGVTVGTLVLCLNAGPAVAVQPVVPPVPAPVRWPGQQVLGTTRSASGCGRR